METALFLRGSLSPFAEGRKNLRIEVHLQARIASSRIRPHVTILTDLSVSGCCVTSLCNVAVGEGLVLTIKSLTPMHSTVRWCTSRAIGLKFTNNLDPRVVDRIANTDIVTLQNRQRYTFTNF